MLGVRRYSRSLSRPGLGSAAREPPPTPTRTLIRIFPINWVPPRGASGLNPARRLFNVHGGVSPAATRSNWLSDASPIPGWSSLGVGTRNSAFIAVFSNPPLGSAFRSSR
jgi:hypothetical protein